MRIVHTFWGKPALKNIDYINISRWMYALSALYIKQNKDAQMIIYLDDIGYDILYDILSIYDEVHIVSMPKEINSKFFAAIKAVALQQEPIGSIHIDGDVFIKTTSCYELLKQKLSQNDLITQCYESNAELYRECKIFTENNIKFDCNICNKNPCNVGVIGFNNEDLKKHYVDNYFDKAKECNKIINKFEDSHIPDLILEQSYLAAYVKKHNYKMGQVLIFDTFSEQTKYADKIGYCHMLAQSKYKNAEQIKNKLKLISPEIYNMLSNKYTHNYILK